MVMTGADLRAGESEGRQFVAGHRQERVKGGRALTATRCAAPTAGARFRAARRARLRRPPPRRHPGGM